MPSDLSLFLPDDAATTRFGTDLASRLKGGDTVLLDGSIGAGKTHLARAIIASLLPVPEDIPSPTYTLVQTYAGPGFEIWHADLYRLTDSNALAEIGLTDAFGEALVLIEWPDRLSPDMVPDAALRIRLAAEGEGRRADLRCAAGWLSRLTDLAHA